MNNISAYYNYIFNPSSKKKKHLSNPLKSTIYTLVSSDMKQDFVDF